MAQETGEVTSATRNLVSIALPAEIRVAVRADGPEEAAEIVRAIFSADWRKAMLEMGWQAPRRGVEFSVRLP